MESISALLDNNIVVVYFFYGLAFFSMGLAVWLEVGRSPKDASATAFLFLAAFGLLHGSHEWLELFIILQWGEAADLGQVVWMEIGRVVLLATSFLLLYIFGLKLIAANRSSDSAHGLGSTSWTLVLVALWVLAVAMVYISRWPCTVECLAIGDVLSRYLLAIPASFLAAWAMLQQRKTYIERSMPQCAKDITLAAAALILYGVVGQSFVRETSLFPSSVINAGLFRDISGVPVQLFRGLMAAAVAIFVIRAMRSFELERAQSLDAAHAERLAAQRETLQIQRKAQLETEMLNQELQEAVQDLTMLFELSRDLVGTLNRDVMLEQAMQKIYERVPRIRGGMILLREGEQLPLGQMATIGYMNGPASSSTRPLEATAAEALSVAELVVATGQSCCWLGDEVIPASQCPCTTGEVDQVQSEFDGDERTMGMPLVIRDRAAGSVVLSMGRDSPWLSPRDLSMIETIAGQLSLALANAKLYREVQTRDALRGELLHQVVSAQEHERQRIARDLHDGVGQLASAVGMGLAAASESVRTNPALAEQQLRQLKTMSGELVRELQVLIAGLRPTVLDDLGLVPALDSLVNEFEKRTGVSAKFRFRGSGQRVEPDVETIVFRIAQEGLTNAGKHAHAKSVFVELSLTSESICLSLHDDGVGFNAQDVLQSDPRQQWGLIGIRERVALVGGSCEIASKPGEGAAIRVCVPLSEKVLDVTDYVDSRR